jgi:hypothetical protein
MPYTRAVVDIALWRRVAGPVAQAKVILDGGGGVKPVVGMVVGSPILVNAIDHGYQTNNVITLLGVRGCVEANGPWPVTVIDDSNFSIDGSVGVNQWTGGGLCVRSPILEFDDPLSRALSFMKVELADPMSPSDDDVANLSQASIQEMLDIAEYEFFDSISTSLSTRSGLMTSQRWPDYSYQVDPQAVLFFQQQSKDRGASVRNRYGYGMSTVRYGSMDAGLRRGPRGCDL